MRRSLSSPAVRPLTAREVRRRHEAIVEVSVPVLPQRVAAAYLGVAEGTLENWRTSGKGPAYVKYGDGDGPGRVLYRVCTLDEFIEAHERASTTDPIERPGEGQR